MRTGQKRKKNLSDFAVELGTSQGQLNQSLVVLL